MNEDDLIYKGDDTDAFGNNLLVVTIHNDTVDTVSKVAVRIGTIYKEYTVEIAPSETYNLSVNLNKEETAKLAGCTEIHLAAWDSAGLKETAIGTIKLKAEAQVV